MQNISFIVADMKTNKQTNKIKKLNKTTTQLCVFGKELKKKKRYETEAYNDNLKGTRLIFHQIGPVVNQ